MPPKLLVSYSWMDADDKSREVSIVEKLNRRDAAGLTEAYERYGSLAYSVILRIVRDSGIAEDLVQELFLRLWNRSGDFDASRGTLSIWILAIARNMAIDYIRSSHSRFSARSRPINQTDHGAISYKPGESDVILDNFKAVKEAFSSLNTKQRQVLEMAYFEGFSQSEIASRLAEPLGTVKSWMRSALSRLRAAMQEGRAQ